MQNTDDRTIAHQVRRTHGWHGTGTYSRETGIDNDNLQDGTSCTVTQ